MEAIRLAKAVLAPRTLSEANNALQGLGVMSPHIPNRLFHKSLTNNPTKPVIVRCEYKLFSDEISQMEPFIPQMAMRLAQQSAGLAFAQPIQVMTYLSSEAGKEALAKADSQVRTTVDEVRKMARLRLNLQINFATGQMTGEHPVEQALFSAIEQNLGPERAIFSYFPAERAMPIGEPPVQIGSADAMQQMESHNSQPYSKYTRLKNIIYNSIIAGNEGRTNLQNHFARIFEGLLKGRALGEIGVNEIGMLSIPVIDIGTGTSFQIDGLSSGEKGLLLVFLLIALNVEKNGLVLLDEPELHLNPAVCRDIVRFFIAEHVEGRRVQGIICSHSAEILASAYDASGCKLFHLKDGRTLAEVRPTDLGEARGALRRLGSSESEALLYRGMIYVEGPDDVEMISAGFEDIIRRYKLINRGGRHNIEGDIKELQGTGNVGGHGTRHFFVFDNDGRPTNLQDSNYVKILQLDRYCIENYLLDADILADLSRDSTLSKKANSTATEMRQVMKELAMSQLSRVAVFNVWDEMTRNSVTVSFGTIKDFTSFKNVAMSLLDSMRVVNETLTGLTAEFEKTFVRKCKERKEILEAEWDEGWEEKCNGKQLFDDMRASGHFYGDIGKLKRTVIREMRLRNTGTFTLLKDTLEELVNR